MSELLSLLELLAIYARIVGDFILASFLIFTMSGKMRRIWFVPGTLAIFFILLGVKRVLMLAVPGSEGQIIVDVVLTPALWLAIVATGYGLVKRNGHKL